MLAPIGHGAARPEGPDDLDRLLEHLVAHAGDGPLPADDVLVQVLARAEPEGEPPVGQQLHRRRLLRDDGGVIAADRAGDVGHQRNVVGRLGGRAEHAPRVRGMALRVEPREVVVADDREVEARFLGEGDVSHQLLRARLLAHHRVADLDHGASPWRSSARHDREILVAEPLIDGLLPFVGQAGKGGEPVVAGCLEGEAHVLERERQRELGEKSPLAIRSSLAACHGDTSGPSDSPSPPSRSRAPTGEQGPPTPRPLRSRTRATCCSRPSVAIQPRRGRPRSCAGRAPRRGERRASEPRRAPMRRSSAGPAPPGPCFPTPARRGASRRGARHRRGLRRVRSRPRRSCSSAPRSRPAREQRACPDRARPR